MFGTGEILVIALVAIIVVDPRKLPDLMKSLGKALGEFKQMSGEFKRTIERETEAADFEKRKAEAEQKLFGDKKEGETADASGRPTAEKPGGEPGSIAEDAQEQAKTESDKAGEAKAPSAEEAPSEREPEAAQASGAKESAGGHAPEPAETPSAPTEPTPAEPVGAESGSPAKTAPAAADSGADASIPVKAPSTPAQAGGSDAPAVESTETSSPSAQHAESAASGNSEALQAATASAEPGKSGASGTTPSADSATTGVETTPPAPANAEEAQAPAHVEEPQAPAHAEEPQATAVDASASSADSAVTGMEATPSSPANAEEAQAPAHVEEPQAPANVAEPAAPSVSAPAAAPAEGGATPPPPPPPPPTGDDAVGEGQAGRMSLFGHLQDLRKRLTRSAIAMVVGFLACYAFAGQMLKVLMQPMLNALKQSHFIYTVPTEAFFTEMKVAFVAGIFVASPYIFYQIYQFVAPGLYSHERRWIAPIAFFSALCFTAGAMFGYFVVFPYGFEFFASYSSDILTFTPRLDDYFDFVVKLLVAFGIVFELPLFLFFLARLGLVTDKGLRKKRKYAILGAFVLSAALTPPDAVSQTMMAVPLVLLYEVGIWLAYFFGKKKPQPEEEAPAA